MLVFHLKSVPVICGLKTPLFPFVPLRFPHQDKDEFLLDRLLFPITQGNIRCEQSGVFALKRIN